MIRIYTGKGTNHRMDEMSEERALKMQINLQQKTESGKITDQSRLELRHFLLALKRGFPNCHIKFRNGVAATSDWYFLKLSRSMNKYRFRWTKFKFLTDVCDVFLLFFEKIYVQCPSQRFSVVLSFRLLNLRIVEFEISMALHYWQLVQ